MAEKTSKLGFTGIAFGSIALLLVLVHFYAGPFSPQPTIETTIAEKAVSIRDATVAALKGKEYIAYESPSGINLDKALQITGSVLGGLAIILGVLGYAKRESARAAGGAAALGAGAIAFQFAVVAIGALIIAILIGAVISQLGIDI